MTHVRILLLLLTLVALPGCEDNPSAIIDPGGSAPVLRATAVAPSFFNLDNQQPVAGMYRLSTTLSATVSDPQGVEDVRQVRWTVYAPSGTAPIAQGTLTPSAIVPGSGTREFTSVATIEVARTALGSYKLEMFAVDGSELRSSIAYTTVTVRLTDAPPILSLAGARQVATSGADSSLFLLSVSATDASGLNDITQVTVRVLSSRDSTARTMYDDGKRSNGDAVAGDGIFSVYAWVFPTTTLPEVVFEYRGKDNAGSESNILRRSANNQPPRFVSLNLPSVIQRPASGTIPVSFFVTVDDPNGRSDIDSVYFVNLNAATPTRFLMYDDGDRIVHGDSVAVGRDVFVASYHLLIEYTRRTELPFFRGGPRRRPRRYHPSNHD